MEKKKINKHTTANKELIFQFEEKAKRAAELAIANEELLFQNEEKEKRAAELVTANKELIFQNSEKEKRVAELVITNKELAYQNEKKEKRVAELSEMLERVSFLATIASNIQDPVIASDKNFCITSWNEHAEKLFGWKREEVIGKDIREILKIINPDDSREQILQSFTEKGHWQGEAIYHTKSGKPLNILATSSQLKDANGNASGILVLARDITERKKAEDALNTLNEELEQTVKEKTETVVKTLEEKSIVLESFGDAFFALDRNWIVTCWNRGAEDNLGVKKNEIIGKNLWEIFPGSEDTISYRNHHHAMETKQPMQFEDYYPVLNIWHEINSYPSENGLSVFFKDITERKESEKRIKESEERFKALIENNQGIISLTDEALNSIYRSPSTERITGWTAEDLKVKGGINYFHPDEIIILKTAVAEAIKKPGIPQPYISRFLHKNGHYIWLEGTATKLPEESIIKGIVFNSHDVTERIELEQLLAKTNSLAGIGSWEVDLVKGTVYWSDITKEIHEVESSFVPDLATGLNFYKEEPGRDLITQKIKEAIELGKSWDEELQIITAKNNVRWIRAIGEAEVVDGICVKIYGSFQDINARKKAALEILKSNRLYAFITAINQSIVHIKEQDELLQKACSIAMETGKFKVAWIGLLNEEDKLEVIKVRGQSDVSKIVEKRSGIDVENSHFRKTGVGKALRTGVYAVSNDVLTDPDMHFLTEELLSTGIRANIVFPIKKSGRVAGVFSLNSDTINFFDDAEIALLQEATNDLSFALENFDKAEQHKKAEEKIKESEKEIRTMAESMPQIVWKTTAEGKNIYFNQQWVDYTGLTLEESRGDGWLIPFHKDDKPLAWKAWDNAVTNLAEYSVECRLRKHDGSYHWWLIRGVPMINEKGEIEKWYGTCTDIEKIKLAEEQLKKSDVFNRGVLNSLSSHIAVIDGMGNIIAVNEAWKQFSMENGETTLQRTGAGSNYFDVCRRSVENGEEFASDALKGMMDVLEGKRNDFYLEYPCHSPSEQRWFGMRVKRFESDEAMVVVAHMNITERKIATEKIKESEIRLAASQSVAKVGSWETDLINLDVLWSDETCRIFGVDNLLPHTSHENFLKFVHPDDKKKVNEAFAASITSNSMNSIEHRIISADGILKEVEERWHFAIDDNGKPIRAMGTVQDITERKKVDKAVEESEAKYRAFFNHSIDGIILTVADGNILAANPAACDMFRMTEEEIIEVGRQGLIDLRDPRGAALIKERQRTGKAQGELTFLRIDGSVFSGEISSAVFKDSYGEERTSMIIRDITKRKEAEEIYSLTSLELQNTFNDLTKIMDSSLDVICAVDENGIFKKVSAASEAVWGYKPEELIGKPIFNFVHHEDDEITKESANYVMKGNDLSHFENRYIRKDGSLVNIEWSARWDATDKVRYGVARDVTEKKRLEKAFETERQQFFDLFSEAPSSMGVLSGPDHRFEMANPLYLQLIGKKDIIGKLVKDVLPEVAEQGFIEILDRVYQTGKTFTANEMLIKLDVKNDGKPVDRYLNFIYQPHLGSDGKTDGILFFAVDVSEQVLSRKKIEESEARLKEAQALSHISNWGIDLATEVNTWSDEFYYICGIKPGDIEPSSEAFLSFVHPEDAAYVKDAIEKTFETLTSSHFYSRILTGDGILKYVYSEWEIELDENNKPLRLYGILQDVTERTQKEEAVLKSEKFLSTLTNSMPEALFTIKLPERRIEFINHAVTNIFGYSPDEIIGQKTRIVYADEDNFLAFSHELQAALERKETHFHKTVLLIRKNGERFWAEISTSFINGVGGDHQVISIIHDISARKATEENLKQSENRFREFFETAAEALVVVDISTMRFIKFNENAVKLLKYPHEQLLKMGPVEISAEFQADGRTSQEYAMEMTMDVLKGDKPVLEWLIKDANGKKVTCELRLVLLSSVGSPQVLASFIDISERKSTEKKIEQKNKELAISNAELEQFAYVASHDLQEPLRMVTSFLTQLEKKYGALMDDKGRQYIDFAVDGAKRMRQIILDLLEFSRVGRTEDKEEDIDLNEVVNEIKILFRKRMQEKKAEIISDLLPHITGYRSPIRQVFQNLISNALIYTLQGSSTKISISCTGFTDHWQFAVRDNGIGIDQEYFEKIFIIFQRLHTKEEFSGTGMGLAITKKIIENQGGKIWVESEEGKGSTFYFTIKK